MSKEKKYPKGHFVGIGLAIGIPFGIPIGLVLGNIALGPAIGLPLGLVLGAILEKKYNQNPIEISEKEIKKRNKFVWIGLLAGIGLFLGLLVIYIASK